MTAAEIKALVTEGAKLNQELEALGEKVERLKQIKEQLRKLAVEKDAVFQGLHGETAAVKQIAESFVRSVPATVMPRVKRAAGKFLHDLFNLAPVPKFELNALRLLPKRQADSLITLLKAASTARVSFST